MPKDPDALKKLRECEKAVAKIRFEEAIAMDEHDRHSVAESLDFHSIGNFCWLCFSGFSLLYPLYRADEVVIKNSYSYLLLLIVIVLLFILLVL